MACNKCAKDIRNNSFIENMREIMEIHPEYTLSLIHI